VHRRAGRVPIDQLVGNGLTDEVVADGPATEAVLLQEGAPPIDVGGVGKGLVHLEVVAPAGQLQAVVAPTLGHRGQLGDRNIGELARKQRHGSCHVLHLSGSDGPDTSGTLCLPVLEEFW